MWGKRCNLVLITFLAASVRVVFGVDSEMGRAFLGGNVHFEGKKLLSYRADQNAPGGSVQVLVFRDGFSLSAGASKFKSARGVVWVKPGAPGTTAQAPALQIVSYLEGDISVSRSSSVRQPGLRVSAAEQGRSMIVSFQPTGEVFVTADVVEPGQPRGLDLYGRAFRTAERENSRFGAEFGALAPLGVAVEPKLETPTAEAKGLPQRGEGVRPAEKRAGRTQPEVGILERIFGHRRKPEAPAGRSAAEVKVNYPVNVAPVAGGVLKLEHGPGLDGLNVVTVIGRFYLWQKRDEQGGLLELEADAAVLYYSGEDLKLGGGTGETSARGAVKAIYLTGDVVMGEGQRMIRADEMYYDFENSSGIAINAQMRNFDVRRRIPIYVRAAKLRRLDENSFSGEDVVLTTSEFHVPQISLGASKVLLTDRTVIDERLGRLSDSSYDAQMWDVRLKLGDKTIFAWPFMRSNLARPDVPVKSVRVGHDSIWGTSVESRWHLSRLLGLAEPEGTNGTFGLDYYSKRGLGSGLDVDYARQNGFGRISGYVISDRGEDRLGRDESRRDLQPPRKLRGRFSWVHRQFMPYNWQVTTGLNYESDENFVESYYRSEFNTSGRRETYIHMKRIEDNWALAFLGKGRINNFADELQEMPSAEFHLTGESIFKDKFTFYSDSFIGQFRQRIGSDHSTVISDERFGFATHRSELDMPLWLGRFKAVPYLAGTFGYDDRSGFTRSMVDGTNAGSQNEKTVWLGETGLRLSSEYWKTYRHIKSRLWALDGLRHVIRPELTAVGYVESDTIVNQRDMLRLGISQRLQTKRGPTGKQRTVDWMRLDTAFTWVDDSQRDPGGAPDRFVWNRPMTPLRIFAAPGIFNGDLAGGLKRFELFGPRRNYFSADYIWRMSDTSALSSDVYYQMQDGVVEQLDVGFTRRRLPDLTYYLGSRYLRSVDVLDEHGSNAFVFAATYVLDPRYTVVFSQQYDFDYGANIDSDITLIRRYHRIFWALSFGSDGSLDRQSVVFSIWPQGVPELAIGSRRYMGLTGPGGYYTPPD